MESNVFSSVKKNSDHQQNCIIDVCAFSNSNSLPFRFNKALKSSLDVESVVV